MKAIEERTGYTASHMYKTNKIAASNNMYISNSNKSNQIIPSDISGSLVSFLTFIIIFVFWLTDNFIPSNELNCWSEDELTVSCLSLPARAEQR